MQVLTEFSCLELVEAALYESPRTMTELAEVTGRGVKGVWHALMYGIKLGQVRQVYLGRQGLHVTRYAFELTGNRGY